MFETSSPSHNSSLRVFIFRHGQTEWNREGRIQGHRDIPLNEKGREDARRLARAFLKLPVGLVLSSDLSRAVDTATIALSEAVRNAWHPVVPIVGDLRLREVDLGQLQGLTHDEIFEKFGKSLAAKLGSTILSDEDLRDLGSESAESLYSRVLAAIGDAADHPNLADGQSLGLSTHGGVLRRLLHLAGGITNIGFSIPNAMFFPFRYDRQTKLLKFEPTTTF